jgi:hypothetical protein
MSLDGRYKEKVNTTTSVKSDLQDLNRARMEEEMEAMGAQL